ncbi:MAG: 3-dehydroquinate synthase [Spirochaetaceae bacterium]|nr:3-dehydroquinate synthase [Spirochaetaceae bacterium]
MKNQIYLIGNTKTSVKYFEKSTILDFEFDRVLATFDNNTRKLFPEIIPVEEIVLQSGETSKNWDSIEAILSKAIDIGAARDSLFVGVGGGVVCDMAAFAGSIYMRGTNIVLIPTTLLAMADAAFGGKTGIDFRGYKNMVGTFSPATEVRICIDLLYSLPEREYLSGLAEIIKHGLLRDKEILNILNNQYERVISRDPDIMQTLVEKSIAVKAWYVEQDAVESGIRTHLNLGHTFGHALESVSNFKGYSHGEAVIWGIIKALKTGVLLKTTNPDWLKEVLALVNKYSYNIDTPSNLDLDEILNALQKDKKKKGSNVQFVLQKKQGETFLSSIADDILNKIIKEN